MPIYNQHFMARTPDGQQAHSAGQIRHMGPIIQVQLGVAAPLAEWLQQNNEEIPSPLTVQGLIDTGASQTTVHLDIIQQFGIAAVGEAEVLSPNMRMRRGIYLMSPFLWEV